MADQKVTARQALTIGVDPIADVMPIVDISAGISGSKKITINDLFIGWGMTPAGATLAKAVSPYAQRLALGVSETYYDPNVTGLTGGGISRLDGIPTTSLVAGTVQMVFIGKKVYFYKLTVGNFTETSPTIIVPDDFNSSTNAKAWLLADAAFAAVAATRFDATSSIASPLLTVLNGSFYNVILSQATQQRNNTLPDSDGTLAIADIVSFPFMTAGYTISPVQHQNQTFILEAFAPIAPINLTLPGWSTAKAGQRISFVPEYDIATFNVSVLEGGALQGTALTALVAKTWYEYVCKSVTGTVATWKRIR